jgi:polar amino acid transport system substrate-binding protein
MSTISVIGEMITEYVTWNSLIVGSSLFLLFFLLYIYAIRKEKKKLNSMVSNKISVMQKAFDVCKDAVLILSEKQEILYANKPMRKLLKLDEHYEETPLGNIIKVDIGKEWRTLGRLIKEKQTSKESYRFSLMQTKLLTLDTQEIPVNLYIDTPEEGETSASGWSIVSIHDLSEEYKQEEAKYHHRLTNLPNQIKALQDINAINAKLHLSNGKMILMLIDIDNLSILRAILGYEQTNAILKKFAFYLNGLVKEQNYKVYHTFYNNFLLVMTDVDNTEEAEALAQRIQTELSTFYKIGASRLYLSASIGISVYPDSGPVIKMFDNAYKALNKAEKRGHGRIEFYVPEIQKHSYDELVLYNDMHEALEKNQFEVYYQAIVDAKSKEVVSAEALIRWHHPKFGMVPPDLFISVMEKTGFIVELGHFVLNEVLKQQKRWELFKFRQIPISINLSLIELEIGTFVEYVKERIHYHQANPDLLRFEITEGLAMQDKTHLSKQFSALKKLGVDIVLDDFGSGYTSYAYLKRFPASILKIDKGLVDHILENKDDQHIVKSIIDLGHSLNMKVVVEGIENINMSDLLGSYGCDYFQGFHFARPLPVFEFQKMLRR